MVYYTIQDSLNLLSTMVVVVHRNIHRSITGESICGGALRPNIDCELQTVLGSESMLYRRVSSP
jgi:hypothetical protein